jgi:ketosteroid isomerase-like protein
MHSLFAALAMAASSSAPVEPAAAMAQFRTGGPASDVAAVRAVGLQWQSHYQAGRFSDIPDLYTRDTVVMPRGRPRIEGREAMRRGLGGLAAGRKVNIEITEREIQVAGNYAWFLGDFRVTYSSRDTAVLPRIEHGRSLILFRRDTDGQWRIHRDMDSPAPEPVTASVGAARQNVPVSTVAVPPVWDPADRTTATSCDKLASSRYDRTRLAKPVAREDIDVPAAILQCEADLAANSNDPRIHFHLGRLYGYLGDTQKSLMHRKAASAAGNHNTIFLLGYLSWSMAKDDSTRCAAAREMKLAADRGNYSAQLTYASLFVEGRLSACGDRAGQAEVAAYVKAARPAVDGFFETRFADHLAAELTSPRLTSGAIRR